jgi:hypothetical protein
MSALKTAFVLSSIAATLFAIPPALLADTMYLFGKIGALPVVASLEQNGGKLAGWYFYQARAKQIRLEGEIDRSGSFRMEEEMTSGRKTGVFEGNMKQGSWAGTWRKAAGAGPLPFHLEENRDQLKNLNGDYECTSKERDAEFQYTYERKLKLSIADGIVKKLDISQGAYTADKSDDHWCSVDLGDLKQVASQVGILLEAKEDGNEEDNGKCAVRIVGDAEILWIRIGASSDPSACRTSSATMHCSPRAFWNDIILDRRTRKCKALN